MNILVYATTFGADLLSTVRYLENRKDVNLKVLLNDPEGFKKEPIFQFRPLKSELITKTALNSWTGIPGFQPDVTLMDNRVPHLRTSPKALMLWHGFGWKGPNDLNEFKWLHLDIMKSWGDVIHPNPDFKWGCYGPYDFEHRSTVSGIHPDNCVQLGAASHDELRTPVDKKELQPFYPFDVVNRQTLMIAPTWHYGEVFSHWGSDEKLFKRILDHAESLNVNVILRFHDSYRFEELYVNKLNNLADSYSNVILKFKDHHPDNFLDLQVSDLLMTNFSSIANLFYATGKPTIHIYPVNHEDEEFMLRSFSMNAIKKKKIDSVKYIWKFPPEDNGGLLAYSFDELMDQFEYAVGNPGCCSETAASFLNKHMLGADGRNRERIFQTLCDMADEITGSTTFRGKVFPVPYL